jgi:hypothetical protein
MAEKKKGSPGRKPGRISLEQFAYLQLFAVRKKANPKLSLVQFKMDLRSEILQVEEEAKKKGHKVG